MKTLFNWLYAKFNGHFWHRCDTCGCGFGGHEVDKVDAVTLNAMTIWYNSGRGVIAFCPACATKRQVGPW